MKRIVLTMLVMAFAVAGIRAQDEATINKVGDKAPLFVCTTLDGHTIDLSQMKGKVVMINFFATWCGPCNQELPVLQREVWEKYRNNSNFVLVVLGREHSEQELKDFATKKSLDLPFASDKGRVIFNLYAKQNIPRNVIIGKDGKILYQSIGYTPEEFKKITDLLAKQLN